MFGLDAKRNSSPDHRKLVQKGRIAGVSGTDAYEEIL